MKNKEKARKILNLIEKGVLQIILFSAMVSFLVCELLVKENNAIRILVFSVFWSAVVQLILLVKNRKYIFLGVLLLMCVLEGLNLFIPIDLVPVIEQYWVQELFLSFFAAVIAQIVCKYKKATRVIIGILFIGMIAAPFLGYDLTVGSAATILIFAAFTLLEIYTKFRYPDKDSLVRRRGTASMLLFCIIPAVIILFFPMEEKPLQWKFVREAVNEVVHVYNDTKVFIAEVKYQVEDAFVEMEISMGYLTEDYQMNFTGFSGQGRLGKGVQDMDQEMLIIGGRKPRGNTYFTGSISDIYTGSGWEKSSSYETYKLNDYQMDDLELYRALFISNMDTETAKDIMKKTMVTVKHSKLRTKSLFYPLKTSYVENHNDCIFEAVGPNLLFRKPLLSNSSDYRVTYLDIDYESEEFIEFLQNYQDYSYDVKVTRDDLMDVQRNYFGIANSNIIFEDCEEELQRREEDIKDVYLQLPDTLPQRVKDLAVEITKDCETPHDKMEAIRLYLFEFEYNKQPQLVTGSDFVDGFLFEGKEGYCTYFSTTAAVLGRCVGVPTRYVEGFYCDYANKKGNADCTISSNRGHAWCEYYVDGVGWIPTEVTPGCGFSREYRHAVLGTAPPTKPSYFEEPKPVAFDSSLVHSQQEEDNGVQKIVTIIGASLLGAVMLTVLTIVLFRYFKRKKTYRIADQRGKIKILFAKMQNQLAELSSDKKGESCRTATDWFTSLSKVSKYEQSAKELCAVFLRVCYSDDEISMDEVTKFENAVEDLKVIVRKKRVEDRKERKRKAEEKERKKRAEIKERKKRTAQEKKLRKKRK